MLTVEHAAPSGRLRLRLAGLRGNAALAAELQAKLDAEGSFRRAEVRPFSGSIVLHHDPGLSATTVLARVSDVLRSAGVASGARQSGRMSPPVSTGPTDDGQEPHEAFFAFFAEHVPTEFENDMHYLQDAAGADVEPCAEIKFRGASPLAAES